MTEIKTIELSPYIDPLSDDKMINLIKEGYTPIEVTENPVTLKRIYKMEKRNGKM